MLVVLMPVKYFNNVHNLSFVIIFLIVASLSSTPQNDSGLNIEEAHGLSTPNASTVSVQSTY